MPGGLERQKNELLEVGLAIVDDEKPLVVGSLAL